MDKFACIQVKVDNTLTLVEFDTPYLTLDDLYKYSDCDTIQIIRCITENTLMCIDDNGKILEKPVNPLATCLYGQWPDDFIVGTAFIGTSTPPNDYDEPDMYAMPYDEACALMTLLSDVANNVPK